MPFGTRNPYAAYQSTGIKTASQGSLVVMLYRGAVKELTAADACFGADGKIAAPLIEKYGKHVLKAQEIIGELQASLNMDVGDNSNNLMSLYIYFNHELTTASINKDRKKLQFVLDMMRQLTGAWETAATTTTATNIAQPVVNIQG